MSDEILKTYQDLIQEDVGNRGLQRDPIRNLVNAFPNDFVQACHNLANTDQPAVAIVTGFFIPHGQPPSAETDGPLGALFLARSFLRLNFRVAILTDGFALNAIKIGLQTLGLENEVELLPLPSQPDHWDQFLQTGWLPFARDKFRLTHLIALERVGPNHTLESFQAQTPERSTPGEPLLDFLHEVPNEKQNRCYTASGKDITAHMSPAHRLFEFVETNLPDVTTIGIGDGGNEIGMGKIPWEVIKNNIPGGGLVACRVATQYLIVCGISNWGAYALAAGVSLLKGNPLDEQFANIPLERQVLEKMVQGGPLVDGVTGVPALSVDSLPFDRYIKPLEAMVGKS